MAWNNDKLVALLSEARLKQGTLIGHMRALGFEASLSASLEMLTVEIIKTSQIEGETLDKEQVRSSLARRLGLDTGGTGSRDRAVEGIVDLMMDATRQFDQALSVERLWGWHRNLFPTGISEFSKITVGRWREGPMQVVSESLTRRIVHYDAPRASEVASEMHAFLRWFNSRPTIDPLLRAAIAHLWFVTIHPFEDGNGRIARAITEMALAQSERNTQRFYSMSAQIQSERRAYYEILKQTTTGSLDITPWLRWFIGCLGRSLEGSGRELSKSLRNAHFWRDHPKNSFNSRQCDMLVRLLNGFKGNLNAPKWAKMQKCSLENAQRDLSDLAYRGIIEEIPSSRSHLNYSVTGLPDMPDNPVIWNQDPSPPKRVRRHRGGHHR